MPLNFPPPPTDQKIEGWQWRDWFFKLQAMAQSALETIAWSRISFANDPQDAHKFLGGPTSGGATTPTFRLLDKSDLPANFYDVGGAWNGKPDTGAVVIRFEFTRQVTFPAGLTGSLGKAGSAATAQKDFDVQKNGSSVGTVRWAAAGTVPSFIMASQTIFAAGDVLTVVAPTQDTTLADISITLVGEHL